MAQLLDLSNELIEFIIEYVWHKDLENLAMTCRLLYKLSIPALQHHTHLQNHYSHISNNTGAENGTLATITAEIIENPQIRLYVSNLELDAWFSSWWSSAASKWPKSKEYSEVSK